MRFRRRKPQPQQHQPVPSQPQGSPHPPIVPPVTRKRRAARVAGRVAGAGLRVGGRFMLWGGGHVLRGGLFVGGQAIKWTIIKPTIGIGKFLVKTRPGRVILITLGTTGALTTAAYIRYPKETRALIRSAWEDAKKNSPTLKGTTDFFEESRQKVNKLVESFGDEEHRTYKSTKFNPVKKPLSVSAAKGRLAIYKRLLKGVSTGDHATVYRMLAVDFSRVYGIDPMLSVAVMHAESAFNPRAKSWADARGLMQIVPSSGGAEIKRNRLRKVQGEPKGADLYDPVYNVEGGVSYLDYLRDLMARNSTTGTSDDFLKWAVMSYNAGYHGVTSGKTATSGKIYWASVHRIYTRWKDQDPNQFEAKLRSKYPDLFRKVAAKKKR